jgi:hypothetical protein
VARIDLSSGIVTTINPPPSPNPDKQNFWHGVYGFIELADGQVWAFGGMSHMGSNEGEITRVDDGEARTLASFRFHVNVPQPEPNPKSEPAPDADHAYP